MNIDIVRVFVRLRLRHAVTVNSAVALRLKAVEARLNEHRAATSGRVAELERRIRVVFEAIKKLMDQSKASPEPREKIGSAVANQE